MHLVLEQLCKGACHAHLLVDRRVVPDVALLFEEVGWHYDFLRQICLGDLAERTHFLEETSVFALLRLGILLLNFENKCVTCLINSEQARSFAPSFRKTGVHQCVAMQWSHLTLQTGSFALDKIDLDLACGEFKDASNRATLL